MYTHTHTRSIALPGPLRWPVNLIVFSELYKRSIVRVVRPCKSFTVLRRVKNCQCYYYYYYYIGQSQCLHRDLTSITTSFAFHRIPFHWQPSKVQIRKWALKPNSITLAGSKLVRRWSQTGSKLVRSWFEPALNQLRTS